MNLFYAKEYFAESVEVFASTVAKLRTRLEYYAARADAQQKYIDERNELIAKMLTYMEASKNVVEYYQSEIDRISAKNAEEYQRGYTAGMARANGEIRDTLSDADNEKLRQINMKTALKKWADHLT